MKYRNLLTMENTDKLGADINKIDLIETKPKSLICYINKLNNEISVYVDKNEKSYNEDTLKFLPMIRFIELHNQNKITLKIDNLQRYHKMLELKEQVIDLNIVAKRKRLKLSPLNKQNTIDYIGA